jgi:Family of unknown function (DUF6496)
MPKQSKAQKDTVERVMHEFKHGELKANGGRKVKNPKQAIAIALSEAGSSNQQSPKENKQRLRKTKAKERAGKTGKARAEGGSRGRTSAKGGNSGKTRAELYQQAKRRDIPGRSKMSKAQLQRALSR